MQCQGEHRVRNMYFYCTKEMGHDGRHRDVAGREWVRMFVCACSGRAPARPREKKAA
jgi:hypothetical protein